MPKQPCKQPGCGELVSSGYCDGCKARGPRQDRRPTAAQRGYGARWQRARLGYLAAHPVCVGFNIPRGEEHEVAASVVDHIVPHGGNYALFWDASNWQALCKACHDRKTATEDGAFGRPKRHRAAATG